VAAAPSANTNGAETGAKNANGTRARKQKKKGERKETKTRGERQWEKQTYYRQTTE